MRHQCIRNYYLKYIGDEAKWQAITQDPRQFNEVWRKMLRLPAGDMPPPPEFRR
jgi:hypothetical protein